MRTPLVSGLGLLLAVTALAQQPPQLKARELFYTPITETKPAPVKEAPSKAAVVKPPKPKPGPQNDEERSGATGVSQVAIRDLARRYSPAERYFG